MELREFVLNPASINTNTPFPEFGFPRIVGYFSKLNDGSFQENFSQLKYAYIPPIGSHIFMDLNKGIHLAKSKNIEMIPVDTSLESLLWWIKNKIGRLDRNTTNFVAYRGLLRLIMCTPYEREPWEILAMSVNGVIYLCAYESEEQFRKRVDDTKKQKMFMSWGFKFEQLLLSDTPSKPPDTSQPVDEREEFCCMFKSNLGQFKLLYGAEMDGVNSKTPLNEKDVNWKNVEFIELKTSRCIETSRQEYTFERYKLLKWWCQCYPVGIKDIFCGFRDDDGIVHELQTFSTQKLHHIAKGKWKPNVCMNFLKDFLSFVQEVVSLEKQEDSKVVWRFGWEPGQPVKVIREFNNDKYLFLPKWFLDIQQRRR